ncbi:MAG: hypothetical protein ACK5GP_05505 [bacterium]|jgi:hypothetical protein|nr:hypothetical protein [Chitinophagaceae bacterium]
MFKQRFLYPLALMIVWGLSANAQFAKSPYVKRDPRVDKLVDKQIELNKQALRVRTTLEPGFRILVISTNKRDQAIDAKSRLLKIYPDQKSYLFYQSPYFKLQFGNFKTMKEADMMKKELVLDFGENLIIIPSQVEVKGEKQEAENF